MSLFDLYLESRKVGNSYEKLFDLIIYDRIKSVLFSLSRHILALESAAENRWIGRHALVDALDAYVANVPSHKSKFLAASSRGIRCFAVRGASVGDVIEGDPLPCRPCSWATTHGDLGRHREH